MSLEDRRSRVTTARRVMTEEVSLPANRNAEFLLTPSGGSSPQALCRPPLPKRRRSVGSVLGGQRARSSDRAMAARVTTPDGIAKILSRSPRRAAGLKPSPAVKTSHSLPIVALQARLNELAHGGEGAALPAAPAVDGQAPVCGVDAPSAEAVISDLKSKAAFSFMAASFSQRVGARMSQQQALEHSGQLATIFETVSSSVDWAGASDDRADDSTYLSEPLPYLSISPPESPRRSNSAVDISSEDSASSPLALPPPARFVGSPVESRSRSGGRAHSQESPRVAPALESEHLADYTLLGQVHHLRQQHIAEVLRPPWRPRTQAQA
eukprot:c17300_g1_i1.p1 GENE.c17300_g1_i1~~c17300_g1_i1.p1  ORF type:complete len:324 (-),score=27.39 c17300_g1_i1:220-1191(-)